MIRIGVLIAALLVPLFSHGGTEHRADSAYKENIVVVEHRQRSFSSSVPAGNYSGITHIGNNRYAVVSDKSETDGFFIFTIIIDSVTGKIDSVTDEGFFSSHQPNRDQEGIAYVPQTNTLYISGEKDNRIMEYGMDGYRMGRMLDMPAIFTTATPNYGLESLTYNSITHTFWTTTESTLPIDGSQASYANHVKNRLRLQSFNDSLQPGACYLYDMDKPVTTSRPDNYAMGVSELCALDDGRLIVLEREFFVPRQKLGSFVNCKLYIVNPAESSPGQVLPKTELIKFRTRLSLFNYGLANYEGLCVGPKLSDGSYVLIMVSDSQNQYRGVLKDWFKTIVIK